jgi:IclR family mhp operon transcriptional activator
MPSYEPVEATLRGLQVLQTVSRLQSCSVNDIHAATGLNRATVVRMLETLVHAGYVRHLAERGRYALTAKTLSLSAGYQAGKDMAERAAPVLASLQAAVGWPCDVAICDGVEMVTVATSPVSGRLAFNQPAGVRASLLGTSLGLAYLAFAPAREQAIALQALASSPEPWHDMARDPAIAAKVLPAIRRRGFATIDPRMSAGHLGGALQTLGVPVLVDGKPIAAMNIIFLRAAVPMRTAIRIFVPPLIDAAARLSDLSAPTPLTT